MLNSLVLLTVSCFAANFMHGFLLYNQRDNRKETISRHATKSNQTYIFYIVGHIIAASSFYLFARGFFADTPQAHTMIIVASVGAIADVIQAFIPARGKLEIYHSFFAGIMALSVITTGVLAATTIPLSPAIDIIAKIFGACLVLSIPASIIVKNKYFYRIQMVSLVIFYTEMFIIVLATR
jgi:hypothetical protein